MTDPLSGRRILVTGGTGFIGSNIVRRLVERGASVRSLDDDSRGAIRRLSDVHGDLDVITRDIRDADAVSGAVRGVDSVLHMAAVNATELFYAKPELVLEVAVKGTTNVIDACLRHRVPELFVASSSEVYQDAPKVPTAEDVPLAIPDPLNPRYSYAGGKIISELLAINYGRRHFDRVVIFRPHNVYGPDMGWDHVIPQLTMRLLRARSQDLMPVPLKVEGTGHETRAFMFIDDAVAAVLLLVEAAEHLVIYHVGSDDEVTIAALAATLGRALGTEVELVPGPLREGSPLRRCPDVRRLRGLGHSPRVTLVEGIRRTVDWYVAHAEDRPPRTRPER